MKLRSWAVALLFGALALTGAGCSDLYSTTPQLGEVEYYNHIITATNTLQTDIQIMNDNYAAGSAGGTQEKVSAYGGYDSLNGSIVNIHKEGTLDLEVTYDMEDATKAEVDAALAEYYDLTAQAADAFAALGEYVDSESYLDDNGKQFKKLEKELGARLDELNPVAKNLEKLVKEKQDNIDLGLSIDSNDPVEIAQLSTDTLTGDAEDAQEAANAWLEAYVASGTPGDTADMEAALETLTTDYDRFKARSDEVGADSVSSYTEYLNTIKAYKTAYEKTVRRVKNGELGTIEADIADTSPIADGIGSKYNDVINRHNLFVNLAR